MTAEAASGVGGPDVERLLEAAPRRLEEVAGAATDGAWVVFEEHGRDFTGEGYSLTAIDADSARVAIVNDFGDGDGHEELANAAWIALASPALAEPLAALLRSQARFAGCFGVDPEALEVARVIVGAGLEDDGEVRA